MANSPLATSQGWGVYALQEEGQHNKTHHMSPGSCCLILLISKFVFLWEKACGGNLECFLKWNEQVSLAVKANRDILLQYEISEGQRQLHTSQHCLCPWSFNKYVHNIGIGTRKLLLEHSGEPQDLLMITFLWCGLLFENVKWSLSNTLATGVLVTENRDAWALAIGFTQTAWYISSAGVHTFAPAIVTLA